MRRPPAGQQADDGVGPLHRPVVGEVAGGRRRVRQQLVPEHPGVPPLPIGLDPAPREAALAVRRVAEFVTLVPPAAQQPDHRRLPLVAPRPPQIDPCPPYTPPDFITGTYPTHPPHTRI